MDVLASILDVQLLYRKIKLLLFYSSGLDFDTNLFCLTVGPYLNNLCTIAKDTENMTLDILKYSTLIQIYTPHFYTFNR